VVIRPLIDALFVYLKQKKEQIVVKGKLEAAFTYLLNQEKYLRVFLEGGDVPMDNNASERAIRGFCIGKKNCTDRSFLEELLPWSPALPESIRK
jgi:transposase